MTDTLSVRRRGIALWAWPLIAVRLAGLLGLLLICVPLYYGLAPFGPRNPAPRLFLRGVAAVVGIRLSTRGPRPARGSFLIANHVSWMDIPALAGATGTAFIAHDGLEQIGPLRWLCSLNDTVFVARHDRRSVAAQIAQVRTALGENGMLTIFAEGTCSDGTATLPFKSSLLSALESEEPVPVQPIWLDYGPEAPDVCWVGEEPGLDNALRMLARPRGASLTVHFLNPLSDEDRADRKRMAAAARAAIDRAMTETRRST